MLEVMIGLVVIFFKKIIFKIVLKISVIVICGLEVINFMFLEDKIVISLL